MSIIGRLFCNPKANEDGLHDVVNRLRQEQRAALGQFSVVGMFSNGRQAAAQVVIQLVILLGLCIAYAAFSSDPKVQGTFAGKDVLPVIALLLGLNVFWGVFQGFGAYSYAISAGWIHRDAIRSYLAISIAAVLVGLVVWAVRLLITGKGWGGQQSVEVLYAMLMALVFAWFGAIMGIVSMRDAIVTKAQQELSEKGKVQH